MIAHFDVYVDPVLTHELVASADNLSSITQAQALLQGNKAAVFGVVGYQVVEKRQEMRATRLRCTLLSTPVSGARCSLPTRDGSANNSRSSAPVFGVKFSIRLMTTRTFLSTIGSAMADSLRTRRSCILFSSWQIR